MDRPIAATCAAEDCGQRFEGQGYLIRESMWSHHDTHAAGDFKERTESGEVILFQFDAVQLDPVVR